MGAKLKKGNNMKRKIFKSYKKIFIFESIMLLLLILNVYNTNILKLYRLPIFLLIADFLFFLILGFEKDNKRLKKEVTFEVFICTIIFLLFYYFYKTLLNKLIAFGNASWFIAL